MIFTNNQPIFRIVDVLYMENNNINTVNKNRHFAALSFRERSDASISYNDKILRMTDGSLSFFPAGLNYHRKADYDIMTIIHLEVFYYTTNEIETFIIENQKEIGESFKAINQIWQSNQSDRYFKAASALYKLWGSIYSEYSSRYDDTNSVVKKAAAYIEKHLTESDLTVSDIANHVNICEVYLRRLFRQELDISPKAYLQNLRIEHAASLLTSGYYTVKEVALKSGFQDEKYFSTAFKKAAGCVPSKYIYEFYE